MSRHERLSKCIITIEISLPPVESTIGETVVVKEDPTGRTELREEIVERFDNGGIVVYSSSEFRI